MKNIVILGGGVLGSQIAFQIAYCGFNVTIWLRDNCSIEHTLPKLNNLKKTYIQEIEKNNNNKDLINWSNGIAKIDDFNFEKCLEKVELASTNIKIELDLKKAVTNADIIVESVAEDINVTKDIYSNLSKYLNDKTIVVTNSSSLLPSKLAKFIKYPNHFLAMHFANSIWKNNMVEIMSQSKTDNKSFEQIMSFANDINMISIPIYKEKDGYLLNSMLIPFLFSSLDLLVNKISDVKSIDKAWKLATGAPKGPFEILDTIGLKTAYNIVLMYVKIPSILAPYNFKGMAKLLKSYIDAGKLGKSSGEGFYKY